MATELETATGGDPSKLASAVEKLLKEIIEKHGDIVFNGDNYSEEWHCEAEKRGLPNLRTAVDALPMLRNPEVIALFEKYNVLSKRETESRMDIYLEQYIKTISTESRLVVEIANTMILPTAVRYQGELAATCANLKAAGYTAHSGTLEKLTAFVQSLHEAVADLEKTIEHHGSSNLLKHYCSKVVSAMSMVRKVADELEGIVADDLWPLPTYQEMLFIK